MARVAKEHGIAVRCGEGDFRRAGVRDAAVERFVDEHGQVRDGCAFAAYVAVRPKWWTRGYAAERQQRAWLRNLCDALEHLIEQWSHVTVARGEGIRALDQPDRAMSSRDTIGRCIGRARDPCDHAGGRLSRRRTTSAWRPCRFPRSAPAKMLIRVHTCGICGTDLKKIATGSHSAPRIFGHETTGVVGGGRRGRHGVSASATG